MKNGVKFGRHDPKVALESHCWLIDTIKNSCYNAVLSLKQNMDVFHTLSQRTKVLIVTSSLFLVTITLGLLVFGTNIISHDNSLLEQAKNSTRADMLYIHPTEGGH